MEMSFEEALLELESIVEKIEEGQLSLDESLVLFERGITLVKECNTRLRSAQQKVEKLMVNDELKSEPFEIPERDNTL